MSHDLTDQPTATTPVPQPILSSAIRALTRLTELGEPVAADLADAVAALDQGAAGELTAELRRLLAPHLLLEFGVGPRGPELIKQLGGRAQLVQGGWRSFLICADNPGGIEAGFSVGGGGSDVTWASGMVTRPYLPDRVEHASTIRDRWWYELRLDGSGALTGRELEFFVLSIYSRDAGQRTAPITIGRSPGPKLDGDRQGDSWEQTQRRRIGTAGSTQLELEVEATPARDVVFDVRDSDGRTCMASIIVRDDVGRVYPSRGLRLAPDMFFQDQVYRASGEILRLPAGQYDVTAWRGPEYRPVITRFTVDPADPAQLAVRLDRWIDPAERGYYSGDPHIHGGGCSHYSQPTEGVTPETMIRHVRGEAIWVSSVLTWGPCYYYQKQFFTGRSISPPATLEFPAHQEAQGVTWDPRGTDHDGESVLRYDVEISGFPSSHSGHLILLGLTDQDYPGTAVLEDWPSWNLPIHQWAQQQGALTGFAHCGLGMATPSRELPNYDLPPFASIGSNELVVDVPHQAADFIAGAEFGLAAEMNVWYHLLNTGFRTLMLGETDFPCVSDERPGIGRTYVSLPTPPAGDRALEEWIEGLRTRASYFGDGRSHAFDVALDGDRSREQRRAEPGAVRLTATVAALLPEQRPAPTVEGFDYDLAPTAPSVPSNGSSDWDASAWHLEWARIGDTRTVSVEVVVNGLPVASRELVADGTEQELTVDLELERSSWVALRLLPSLHTQPIFVEIGDRPIRASRRSAQWLYDCVDKLWQVKHGFIRPAEREAARAAYDQAQTVYAARRDESEVE
ncbi:CehA/McbA family metallohydrolase [Microlunatus speluncae]|uniref:CehA/McbA family metallohydrolase n=1 Tax=Microlunatus speluncae TaxID=2594267 RepID=UPI00126607CB|nr:CehA/McbA family metallohydrolase [Microlunatus speluncae]